MTLLGTIPATTWWWHYWAQYQPPLGDYITGHNTSHHLVMTLLGTIPATTWWWHYWAQYQPPLGDDITGHNTSHYLVMTLLGTIPATTWWWHYWAQYQPPLGDDIEVSVRCLSVVVVYPHSYSEINTSICSHIWPQPLWSHRVKMKFLVFHARAACTHMYREKCLGNARSAITLPH